MKKLLLVLCTLLGAVGAWAQTYTITFDVSNGTFYKDGKAVTTGWVSKWVSNEAGKPAVTLTASANNINADNGRMAPGSSTTSTYTLTTEDAYEITGFALDCPTFGAEVTVTPAGEDPVVAATGENIVVNSSASSFVYSGNNSGRIKAAASDGGSFTITVKKVVSDEQLAAYEKAKEFPDLILSTSEKLMGPTTNQWTSEAADVQEGCLDCLTDGNLTNLFHSDWHGNFTGGTHYIDAKLPEAKKSLHLYYVTRSSGTGCPKKITVNGSNDDGATWTEDIAVIEDAAMPTTKSTQYISEALTFSEGYSYLRFLVPATNSGTNSWFCLAEANLLPATELTAEAIALSRVAAKDLTDAQITRINAIDAELRSALVSVTYELYEADGSTLVSTVTVTQEANSDVAVPTSFANNYFDLTIQGTIGTEDCTIKVIRTLKNNAIVYPITNLSNSKSYYIYTRNQARGGLSTYTDVETTYLASPVKSALGVEAKKFAILSYENNYYLYSVEDAKFVTFSAEQKAPLAATVTGTSDRIAFSITDAPLFMISFDGSSSKIFNSSGSYTYGIVFNTWGSKTSQWDDGCQYTIEEADDFDPTAALAALEEHFHPSNYASYVEDEVKPWFENAGGYFQLKSSVVDANQSKYEAALVNCTQETYEELKALIVSENMVYPETGYYRIKSSGLRLGETYIGYGTPKNSTVGLVTIAADDALNNPSTVIRMDATATTGVYKLSLQGLNVQNQTSNNTTFPATTEDGVEFTFVIRSPGVVAITNDFDAYGYLHESNWAAPAAVVRWTVDAGASQWTVEDATTVSVPLTTIGEASYATAYLPFGVTAISGAAANVLELSANGKYVKAQAISEVPAGTGIVLIGAANAEPATLTIGDVTATVTDNVLTGHYVAGTVTDAYVLANGEDGLGFYALDGAQTVAANKAYIEKQADVKAILFGDDETGIESLTSATATDSTIYNMAGQRVSKAVRGLYIVGGKKVVVK